jgi:type VI secretion system protein ImpI
MPLTLQLVNETTLPDGGPVCFSVSGKRGADIGRAAHLDWTLPDPTRCISSKHCEIRYKDGGYWLHDVSTNGTFVNGADHRMHAPHRLRNGDRFIVGHYIVAVTLDGEEASKEGPGGVPQPAVRVSNNEEPWNDQQLWVSEGDVPPPINPKELRPARHDAPVHPDFLDWAAEVNDPSYQSAPDFAAPPPTRPMPAPVLSNLDWAEGPPSHVRTPPPAPTAPLPAPRRPGGRNAEEGDPSWEMALVAPKPSPAPTGRIPDADGTSSSSTAVQSESYRTFIGELARSAGLPDDLLVQKEPKELAQQIGLVLGLLAENLMQLLSARQQAKRMARSSSHTIIQPNDNNPLKFCPSAGDALRIMFGPQSIGYLDAHRAIAQGFEDLKVHQIKTYSAMQHALARLIGDLDPKTIERETEGAGGIGSLLQSRKAKLWEAYEARWDGKVGRKSGEAIETFMRYLGQYYDRDGG